MNRLHAKLITAFLSFVIPFGCTLLPIKVSEFFNRKGRTGQIVLSGLMCFGGGVFFGTFMLHMAPESRDILYVAILKEKNITYPVADLIMALGFFLVLTVEKIVLDCNEKPRRKSDVSVKVQCLNHKPISGNSASCSDVDAPQSHKMYDIEDIGNGDCPLSMTGDCCKDPRDLQPEPLTSDEGMTMVVKPELSDEEQHMHEAALLKDAHSRRAIVLLIALSFHRIFEGMSIGLQHTLHNVWNLFVAVMCHETVIGFSLGLQFVRNNWPVRRVIITSLLCSLIMPVGVIAGTLLIELGDTSKAIDITNGVLQSLATGTFIYVTFFEILGEEISPHNMTKIKLFCVFLGFVTMACLSAVPEEDTSQMLGHDGENATISC